MPIPYKLDEMVELPGADDYVILKSLLEQFEFGELAPAQSLVATTMRRSGRLLEEKVTLIYTPERQLLDIDAERLTPNRVA